jgi:hypothetical protein
MKEIAMDIQEVLIQIRKEGEMERIEGWSLLRRQYCR